MQIQFWFRLLTAPLTVTETTEIEPEKYGKAAFALL